MSRNTYRRDKLGQKFGKTDEIQDLYDILNDRLPESGFLLDKDVNGEIIQVSLAPSESKIVPHGLKVIPSYRIILRQTGNAVITDVNANWTKKTIGLKNESANAVVLTIKLLVG